MKGHCTSGRLPFLRRQARAFTCQPSLSLRVVACTCSALARHCARSLWNEAQHVRLRRASTPRQADDSRSIHHGRALHERKPQFHWRQARAPTCQISLSLRVVACSCRALARYRARSLWGRGPARALPTRVRAAPSGWHSVHALWKGTARARSRSSFGARPVLPRASPPSFCAWCLARVARLRATALALSGDEAQHVCFRRARAPIQVGDTRPIHY